MTYSFSIVIPVYNAEKYIKQMIESIINQSYPNWKLIIIDDGSTDKSGEICDLFQNDKIEVYHFANQGQMLARIQGIERADGDYTLVVDADDVLVSDCLERVNHILNRQLYDMVMFPYRECDQDLVQSDVLSTFPEMCGEMSREQVIQWVIGTYNHGLCNKVIKTELIKKGILEATKKRLRINGDYALIVPILCQISKAFFWDEPLYLYRIHGMSISHNACFQHILDTDYVSRLAVNILKKYNLWDENMQRIVNVAYLHMIAYITESLILKKRMTKKELMELSELEFYKDSRKYEIQSEFRRSQFIQLKVMRQRSSILFPLVHLIFCLKNVKARVHKYL